MAEGHAHARHYPVPMLWTEAWMARERLNRELASQAILTQLAAGSILSEKAGKAFKKEIRKLVGK